MHLSDIIEKYMKYDKILNYKYLVLGDIDE